MKNWFMRFMTGRYGQDQLSKFTVAVAFVCIILSMIFRRSVVGSLLDFAGMFLLIYTYFRMFSRNISKRYAENQKFLGMTYGLRAKMEKRKRMQAMKKTHHIYTCPGCGQKIRIPRGSGKKVEIDCPKCHAKFIKKI